MYIHDENQNFRSHLRVPFPRSYWVIPGLLLAGEYPGSRDYVKEKEKLTGLLDAGILQIINLMEPDETNYSGRAFTEYDKMVQSIGKD